MKKERMYSEEVLNKVLKGQKEFLTLQSKTPNFIELSKKIKEFEESDLEPLKEFAKALREKLGATTVRLMRHDFQEAIVEMFGENFDRLSSSYKKVTVNSILEELGVENYVGMKYPHGYIYIPVRSDGYPLSGEEGLILTKSKILYSKEAGEDFELIPTKHEVKECKRLAKIVKKNPSQNAYFYGGEISMSDSMYNQLEKKDYLTWDDMGFVFEKRFYVEFVE